MVNSKIVLGIDTSNYTTSVACCDEKGTIVLDKRIPLVVKQGERGLRQSHALFQHMENLPELLEDILTPERSSEVAAIAVSSRPRPVEGSYMPVFKAGLQFARVLSAAYRIPLLTFSHQEGHLAAGAYETALNTQKPYLAYHLSGGTCELLQVEQPEDSGTPSISIIGGTKDISFGQVLDRIGVSMGLSFPCGREMDRMALASQANLTETEDAGKCPGNQNKMTKTAGMHRSSFSLKAIPADGLYINLSGLETQAQRAWETLRDNQTQQHTAEMSRTLLEKTSDCLLALTNRAAEQTGISQILFTGGVSASQFLRNQIQQQCHKTCPNIQIFFGNPALSSDNAAGVSILGGKSLWH